MRTIRGFFADISTQTTKLSITGEYYNYFKNVLRLKKSDFIELFNNNDGFQYKAQIIDINNKSILLEVIEKKEIHNENKYIVNIYQAIIKNENFEFIIQKATELGVNNIYPIITEYTNHKFDKKGFDKKLERWNKIAIAAAEQCGRVFIPKIHYPIEINSIHLSNSHINIALCPYSNTPENFENLIKTHDKFNIFIGPEGGFSNKEMELFKTKDFNTINLGKRILKAETAPINILAIINFIK
ncbi:RNA methyltransferase, RsmE family protein [Francisella philomiragia]|uniref:16S rRNA (uracil(1498)-N(3))-methyltransferase n=1 Tax=Francisella philomiragia TaxID=28110 RepID=UPI0005A56B59|nr:16S rRNA (uracil(1498)-N(3))-methyltransferase [Francisella philomiragia]AJI55147.1 RNA methyltransferase, RsmE family protein [Francisella philomiragia]MBK2252064.1 16S rRNA (uracil(1498)-N(3))-methyltransferase [Francisella philomiragia]